MRGRCVSHDISEWFLLNEEEDIEKVNEDGANEGSEEDRKDDDYEDTKGEIDVHLEDSDDHNEIEDDD